MCHDSNMSSSRGLAVAATGSFPSPAQDYYEGRLDLDRHLIKNRAATFVLRVRGDGLRSAGILDGDELIVDRSLPIRPGLVVVVVLEGEHRVGRLVASPEQANTGPRRPGGASQGPAEGPRWALATDDRVSVLPDGTVGWGVVTAAIHHLLGDPGGRPGDDQVRSPG
jgi:DNA polymerase V